MDDMPNQSQLPQQKDMHPSETAPRSQLLRTLPPRHDKTAPQVADLSSVMDCLAADLFRYEGKTGKRAFLKHFMFTPGYKYTVWMRLSQFAKSKKILKYSIYPILKWILLRCRYKYGIAIPEYTSIGPGLFINRFGGIYVHGDTIIGRNVNITHGTVLGYSNRGRYMGAPIIGDRVFFASGSKVMGSVTIGDGAAIGMNAVVTKDIPENGVAVGIPAKVISLKGSNGYVNRIPPGN